MDALQQLLDSAVAALTYGVDRQGDVERMRALSKRMAQLKEVWPLTLACHLSKHVCSGRDLESFVLTLSQWFAEPQDLTLIKQLLRVAKSDSICAVL